jgi:hypothetical protein
MFLYVSPENEYPCFPQDIINRFPEWTLGDDLPEGWSEVEVGTIPECLPSQRVEENPISEINGKWVRSFKIIDLTSEEIATLAKLDKLSNPNWREDANGELVEKPDSGFWEWDLTKKEWIES